MRPEWARTIWVSASASQAWEPRLKAVQGAWHTVELESVRSGLRGAAILHRPLLGEPNVPLEGDRWVVGPEAMELATAYGRNDHDAAGAILGYPRCCREFFVRTWGQGLRDTVWEMSGEQTEVSGPIECNILGRWMGVRMIPHLPCSFACEATVKLAQRLRPFWDDAAWQLAEEVLSWPMEWSAVHGVAEVRWPILKIAAEASVAPRRVVRREGTRYPQEGASGNTFPYLRDRYAVAPLAIHRPVQREVNIWSANGFSSLSAMLQAHRFILSHLRDYPPQGAVLDLGCGNGRLLDAIEQTFRVPIMGVEAERDRAGNHPSIHVEPIATAIRTLPRVDTILVSARRIEESPPLEHWVRTHARQVFIYSYDSPRYIRRELCEQHEVTQ